MNVGDMECSSGLAISKRTHSLMLQFCTLTLFLASVTEEKDAKNASKWQPPWLTMTAHYLHSLKLSGSGIEFLHKNFGVCCSDLHRQYDQKKMANKKRSETIHFEQNNAQFYSTDNVGTNKRWGGFTEFCLTIKWTSKSAVNCFWPSIIPESQTVVGSLTENIENNAESNATVTPASSSTSLFSSNDTGNTSSIVSLDIDATAGILPHTHVIGDSSITTDMSANPVNEPSSGTRISSEKEHEVPMPRICKTETLNPKSDFAKQDFFTLTPDEEELYKVGDNIFIAAQLLFKSGAWREMEAFTKHIKVYKKEKYEQGTKFLTVDYIARILIDLLGYSDKLTPTNMKVMQGNVASSSKYTEFVSEIFQPIVDGLNKEPAVIVGDQQTWIHMKNAIRTNPNAYPDLYALPGGLHIYFALLNHINEIYGLPILNFFEVCNIIIFLYAVTNAPNYRCISYKCLSNHMNFHDLIGMGERR